MNAGTILVLVLLGLSIWGISNIERTPIVRPEPKFINGELVKTVVGDVSGQIVGYYCFHDASACEYQVRLYRKEDTTNTYVTKNDSPIDSSQFSILEMEEYELKKLDK